MPLRGKFFPGIYRLLISPNWLSFSTAHETEIGEITTKSNFLTVE
jgi:hypothetical protein